MAKKEPSQNEPVQQLGITDESSLKNILSEAFSGADSTGGKDDSYKELETAKLIIATFLNPAYINSTSNLSAEEIDDISDAYYMNLIFDDELIDKKITSFIELKRSETKEPKNLLSFLSEIAGKGIDANRMNQNNGLISRFIGNRTR